MRTILLLFALTCLVGCASEVVRHPATMSGADREQGRAFVVLRPATIRLDSGYERTISAGTEFVVAGSIRQGRVLKPANTVFTIEGAHAHEAYPVLDGGRIVGFYLPVEKAFSPLSLPIELSIQERRP